MSRESVFTVEAPANWINSNSRAHRFAVAKLTKAWREAGREAVEAYGWEPYAGKVHIVAHVWKPRGGRYDVLNLWPTLKAAIDGVPGYAPRRPRPSGTGNHHPRGSVSWADCSRGSGK